MTFPPLFRMTVMVVTAASVTLDGGSGRSSDHPPRVVANDNLVRAGSTFGDTVIVRLVLQRAEWRPEGDNGPHIEVEAFGEAGRAPTIPAPLIRVPAGTIVRAVVRNALTDSTAHVIGLGTHPINVNDTLHLGPGDSSAVTFVAGAVGTFLYRAVIGTDLDDRESERETTGGAFVVDPVGGSQPDRIFVVNIYGQGDSTGFRNALAINGMSWPHTERLRATVGDSLRWRVINASTRGHPMHLHGFYFRTTATGDGLAATPVDRDRQRLDVTDGIPKWNTREITWSPDRPGNWLFHCHLTFHVIPGTARLDVSTATHDDHAADATKHMAGLVLGIAVAPREGVSYDREPARRTLDLYFNQGPVRGRAETSYSYVLKQGAKAPHPDSMLGVGSTIVVTRGEPTDIVVHNQAREGTSIHWHGIELESWSDGVAGWSGQGTTMAPVVGPGQSFTARLSLPRAGTFMYHTHLNDVPQVTGGAVGALLVLEPGERYDPARDHVYIGHWNGATAPPGEPMNLLVNGDLIGAPERAFAAGVTHRFRLINIGPANNIRFEIRRDTTMASWRGRAKDGADLPTALQVDQSALQSLAVGETFDFDFTPPAPDQYVLTAAFGVRPAMWTQRLTFK